VARVGGIVMPLNFLFLFQFLGLLGMGGFGQARIGFGLAISYVLY